jgi:hypothetical protein
MLALFLVRDFGQKIHAFVVIPSTIAELCMVGYLLVIGVKTVKPYRCILAAECRLGLPARSSVKTAESRSTTERQAVSANARG